MSLKAVFSDRQFAAPEKAEPLLFSLPQRAAKYCNTGKIILITSITLSSVMLDLLILPEVEITHHPAIVGGMSVQNGRGVSLDNSGATD